MEAKKKKTVEYELKIRYFESISGGKKTINRNNKKLEVPIPRGLNSGSIQNLSNALRITDGCEGDILIQINIVSIEKPDPIHGTNLSTIFENCLHDIGGGANEDLRTYLKSRSTSISREEFLQQALWAVWGSGMSRKSNAGFRRNNARKFANINYEDFGSLNTQDLDIFMARIHGVPVTKKASQKWKAIHHIAKWLSTFPSEESFRDDVFQGKSKGSELDATDANKLFNLNLPFIREANANFLIKNLGGESIKQDRWINAFLKWGGISIKELKSLLSSLRIPFGFYDNVIWSYCEMYIGKVYLFDTHFSTKFGCMKK